MSFARKFSNKYSEKIIGYCYKSKLDAEKNSSKKVVHKTAETRGKFTQNRNDEKIVKSNKTLKRNRRNKCSTRKKRKIIKQINTSIMKWNTIKYLNY